MLKADAARFLAGVDMFALHCFRTCYCLSSYIAVAGVTCAFYITLLTCALRLLVNFRAAFDGLHYSFNLLACGYSACWLLLSPCPTDSNTAYIASDIIYFESAKSIMHSVLSFSSWHSVVTNKR